MDSLLQEIRHSLRGLRRSKGLAAGAALALALGIGATTTLFSIVHGGTRSLPFAEAHELVVLAVTYPRQGRADLPARAFEYRVWTEQQTSFEALAAFNANAVNIADVGMRPERRSGVFIAPLAFHLIDAKPARGRTLEESDAAPDAPAVAVIGYDLWQSRYAADPAIVGRVIRVDGRPRTVVGVMPPRFGFPVNQEVWLPLRTDPGAAPGVGAGFHVFGRLRDGVTLAQARAEMNTIAARIARAHPATHEGRGVRVLPFVDMEMDPETSSVLYLMLLAVSFVLVIACANVANLLLARAATRARELAVRTALGASRARLIVQHLLESLALAVLGGAGGVLLAYAGVRFFDVATANIIDAFWIDFRVDTTVLAFATALITIAGVAAGILPALRASNVPSSAVLKQSAGAGGLRIGRISRALVVVELALMCGLLAVAGTFVKAALGLRAIDLPVPARAVLTAELSLGSTLADTVVRARVLRELTEQLQTAAAVHGAALISTLPGRGAGNWTFALDAAGPAAAPQPAQDSPQAQQVRSFDPGGMPTTGVVFVTPGFLQVLDAHVLRGRDLTWSDDARSPAVALVNESWVRRFSPDRDPVGRTIAPSRDEPITIVGVVPDLQLQDPGDERADGVYLSMLQHRPFTVRVMARAAGNPLALLPIVRERIAAVDPDLPLFEVASLYDAIYAEASVLDAFGVLFGIFGAGALFLAVLGLYGVVAFGVTQRTREFGVRIALGAVRRDILALVVREGSRSLALGAVLGLLLALALQFGLAAALEIVRPGDPVLFAAIFAALLLTALVALLVPASRAAATEPLQALRYD